MLLLLFLIGVFLFVFFFVLLLELELVEVLLLIPLENIFILYLLNIAPFDKLGLLLTYLFLTGAFCMKLKALFCPEVLNKGLCALSNFFLKTLKAL